MSNLGIFLGFLLICGGVGLFVAVFMNIMEEGVTELPFEKRRKP